MKCDNCPAMWAERDIMTACGVEHGDYGCTIRGREYGGEGESCYLTKEQVERKLKEWEDYQNGKLRRPKWVLNKFINDMDRACVFSGEPSLGLPQYPTLWHSDKKRYSLYGHIDYDDARKYGYRDGYRDAKEGKDEKY